VTQVAVVDELSAAGDLVKGKFDQVPVAVVRGFSLGPSAPDGPGAAVLVRDAQHDLFSLGTAEARAEGLNRAATLTDAVLDPAPPAEDLDAAEAGVARALALVTVAPTTVVSPAATASGPAGTLRALHFRSTGSEVALGMDVHRLRCALAAEGLATVWLPDPAVLAIGLPAQPSLR